MSGRKILAVAMMMAVALTLSVGVASADEEKLQPVPEASAAPAADCCCCAPCCPPPPVKMALKAKTPCCCWIDVCVCVPACCKGDPCCTTYCGLFGRVITEYSWCCGYSVKIIVTRRGRVIVR